MVDTVDNEHPEAFVMADLDDAAARLARILRDLRPDVVVSDDADGTYGHPDHVQAHRVTERAIALAADPHWVSGQEPWRVPKRYVHAFSRQRLLRMHNALLEAGLASPLGDAPIDDVADSPFGADDAAVTTRVDVGPWLDRKRDAMQAHRSQIAADSFFFNLPDGAMSGFFGVEEFVLLSGRAVPGSDGVEDDLFAGL